jgi:hypothetical protein
MRKCTTPRLRCVCVLSSAVVCVWLLLLRTHVRSDISAHALVSVRGNKVFGVGLSRTGSSSLAMALSQLNYSTLCKDQGLAPFLYDPPRAANMSARYDDVDAVVDLPTALYFNELLSAYPDALFILTIRRDSQAWFRSFKKEMHSMRQLFGGLVPLRVRRLIEHAYGTIDEEEDTWIDSYESHNLAVQRSIPASQLLVMDMSTGAGWRELCSFLRRHDGPCANSAQSFPKETSYLHRLAISNYQSKYGDAHNISPLGIKAQSKYAYTALLSDPSEPSKRDYLIGALVAALSIRATGSTADIVFMILGSLSQHDEKLIAAEDIRVVRISSVGLPLDNNPEPYGQDIAAIYRAKARVNQLVEYSAIIFFDCDLMFLKNVDHMFETEYEFLGRRGSIEPLNTGFFVIKPSLQSLLDMIDISLTKAFTPSDGWLEYGSIMHWAPQTENQRANWTFYCASTDQGLFYYYYFCVKQNVAYVGKSFQWADAIEHFAGVHKPNHVTDLKSVPVRFRATTMQWLKYYGQLRRKLKIKGLDLDATASDLNHADSMYTRLMQAREFEWMSCFDAC